MRNRLRSRLPWGVRHAAYAGLRITAPLVIPRFAEISPYEAASDMPSGIQVLILTGTADQRATADEARAIAERIGPTAQLVVFDGGGHLQLSAPDPALYQKTILDFLETCRTAKR